MRPINPRHWILSFAILALFTATVYLPGAKAVTSKTGWTIIGWNDLGMHCMDRDFSVFSLLPPYNNIRAQVVNSSGKLVKSGSGLTVTYEPVADPTGSINSTSSGKTNFWAFAQALFSLPSALAPNMGLAGFSMPGATRFRKPMTFDSSFNGFVATGIPITPTDDAGATNTYPMMRLSVRNSSGTVLTSTNIVLPVSTEMSCKLCHSPDSTLSAAMPAGGWIAYTGTTEDSKDKTVRLNILKLHDDKNRSTPGNAGVAYTALYQAALAKFGYSAAGLYATVTAASGAKPVLCANCHASNALPGTGYTGVPALTASIHTLHGKVIDPVASKLMNDSTNRDSCYRCHPGSATKCLRGAMGSAVASDGSMSMQCQSCHGNMATVGAATRTGWLEEPSCQNCHTGTAIKNNGQIRYTSVFDASGNLRTAVNQTFATSANAPKAPYSLYRFSAGHGGLQCEACHGSTHAEYPSSHVNDNLQSIALQGHKGLLGDCTACHVTVPATATGGPHGMHPNTPDWVKNHHDYIEKVGLAACQGCHGGDYRGTELSRANGDRTFSTEMGTKTFWRGFQIGCYTCHNGPRSDDRSTNTPPAVSNASITTSAGMAISFALTATDANGNPLTLRIVSQPAHGTAGLNGVTASYFPDPGYSGADSFTFAAWDGYTNSNLGTVGVTVK